MPSYTYSNIPNLDNQCVTQPTQEISSFAFSLPNAEREMEKIKDFVHTTSTTTPTAIHDDRVGRENLNQSKLEFHMIILKPGLGVD